MSIRGRFDYGPYCGFWPSMWLTRKYTLRENIMQLEWALARTVFK